MKALDSNKSKDPDSITLTDADDMSPLLEEPPTLANGKGSFDNMGLSNDLDSTTSSGFHGDHNETTFTSTSGSFSSPAPSLSSDSSYGDDKKSKPKLRIVSEVRGL